MHSQFAPSGAKTWLLCPASIKLNATLPPSKAGKPALEGTAMHTIAEMHLRGTKNLGSWTYDDFVDVHDLGEIIPVRVTEGMLEAVGVYVDYVMDQAIDLGAAPAIERRVSLESYGLPEVYGTADLILDGVIHLNADFKGGVQVSVDAEDNPQIMIYSAGAATAGNTKHKTLRMAIVQPRDKDGSKPAVREAEIPFDQLTQWVEDVVRPAVQLAKSDDPPFNPGKEQCRYCDAKYASICPALHNLATTVITPGFSVKRYFEDHQLTLRSARVPPDPAGMSNHHLGEVLQVADLVIDWAKAVQAEAAKRAAAGETIPGTKLVCGKGSRSWTDVDQVEALLRQWIPDQMYKQELLSVAQAEALLKKNRPAMGELLKLINRTPGAAKLVPDTDPRPALDKPLSAAEAFKEFLE